MTRRGWQLDSHQPCVIACRELHVLTAAGSALLCLPLTPVERKRMEQAIACAHRAMLRSALPAQYLRPTYVEDALLGEAAITQTEGGAHD